MPTLNDAKLSALQTLTSSSVGTVKDLERQWLETLTRQTPPTISGKHPI